MFNKRVAFLSFGLVCSTNVFADATLLLNNQTIPNACNITNLGVASGSVNIVATFEPMTYVCGRGYYLPADGIVCAECSENNYCPGGEYTYNAESAAGITACPSGLFAPVGMWESAQCGRLLHLGDTVLYLRSVRKTTPSLNVMIGNNVFYGSATTTNVPIHTGTEHKLKISDGTNIWYIHDDTVTVDSDD